MCIIAESNVLLRAHAELPLGFRVATEEFRDGWNRMRSGGAGRIKKKVQTRGWNFIKISDGTLRSGVGETSQAAIASALKLALRHVDQQSNAVEIERIELTKYPWFFLARVRVFPYRIQLEAVLPVSDMPVQIEMDARHRKLSPQLAVQFPQFGGVMPMLKQMLTSSRSVVARG
jgi:hypothetical protein